MWLKPHQWEMVPKTKTEIRRAMNVRESQHTVMLFPRRYQNIDTGKFDSDKLQTIYSQDLAEIMSQNCGVEDRPESYHESMDYYSRLYHIDKFVPKDNDFDEEERQRELDIAAKAANAAKIAKAEKERVAAVALVAAREKELKEVRKAQDEYIRKEREQRDIHLRRLENERDIRSMQHRVAEEAYQKQLQEVRARLAEERRVGIESNLGYAINSGGRTVISVTRISANKWIPK